MRTTWVTGDASGEDGNYPGRWCTPWREYEHVLQPDLSGTDNPQLFPFEPMDLRQMVAACWRVESWAMTWDVRLQSSTSGASFSTGGVLSVRPRAFFPPDGVEEEIGPDEEYRLGAGFNFSKTEESRGVRGFPNALVTVQGGIGGTYQYILPNGTPQRFRPIVLFIITVDLAPGAPPGAEERVTYGIKSSRSEGKSYGISSFRLPAGEDVDFETYVGEGQMIANAEGQSIVVGPSNMSASVSIEPEGWWPYADGAGLNPIYDSLTGSLIGNASADPSTEPIGRPIIHTSFIPYLAFTGQSP